MAHHMHTLMNVPLAESKRVATACMLIHLLNAARALTPGSVAGYRRDSKCVREIPSPRHINWVLEIAGATG
jgi:hypothetical protein